MNVGVILYCPSEKFLACRYLTDLSRLQAFSEKLDVENIAGYLQAFDKITQGGTEGGSIGCLPAASRFRWLSATRSSVLQCSKVHPGYCLDPEATLNKLFENMVA